MDKNELRKSVISKYDYTNIDKEILNNLFNIISSETKNEKVIKHTFDDNINKLMNLKERLYSKYYFYNIDINILDQTFNKVIHNNYELIDITRQFEKVMDKIVLEKIKNKEIDINLIKTKYNFLKTMIKMNSKYNISSENISKTYEKAIELLKMRYDDDETMSFNIISNMKYIIQNNFIDTNIKNMVTYDINFFKEYFDISKEDTIEKISNDIDVDTKVLNNYIYKNEKAPSDVIDSLCIIYDAEDYDELKNRILEYAKKLKLRNEEELKLRQQHEKAKELQTKLIERVKDMEERHIKDTPKKKRYSLKFLKEYVELYNIPKKELSEKLHCGINKVDDILEGRLAVKDTIVDDIAYEFGAKNYRDLYNKTIEKINTAKLNKKQKEKALQERKEKLEKKKEQGKQKLKNVIIIDELPDEKVFNILNLKNMSYKDQIITLLLFSNVLNKTIDEISDFLMINKSYILKVYINDLEILKEELTKENNSIKLVHKNEEVD